MSEKLKVKVVLKHAKTYTVKKKKFIKDVPVIVQGEEAKDFLNNGHFYCKILSGEFDSPKKSMKSSSSSSKDSGKKLLKKKKS